MKWRKQGLVYAPRGNLWWARSHAFNPTAEIFDDHSIRIYFASLDEELYGRIGYVDLDADNPKRIIRETEQPVLDLGDLGTFDDSGVNPSCLINIGSQKYLYYIGWQRCQRVPYMLFTGLAISNGEESTFRKYSPIPILDRTPTEPFSRSALFVLRENHVFKGWYWSCKRWSAESDWVRYHNVIRYAESSDGIHWNRSDKICIAPEGRDDYAVGRPWVLKEDQTYKMWYSIRSRAHISYRIGYAESMDGASWLRKDSEVGIQPSENGWDSEMLCHPCVVDVKGKRYLFYNGNRHGSTGFGYAVLES